MFNFFRKRKKENIKNNIGENTVILDFGNYQAKVLGNNKKVMFRNVCRKVNSNLVSNQVNQLNINGSYYIFSESRVKDNSAELKVNRGYCKELITYAIHSVTKELIKDNLTNQELDIKLHLLLPLSQLDTEPIFRKLLEKPVVITLENGHKVTYNIKLIRCYEEGGLCLSSYDNSKELKPNKIIFDLGAGTLEVFVYDQYNNLLDKISIPQGMRNLVGRYLEVVKWVKNVVTMNKLLAEKYPFTKAERDAMAEVDREFIEGIMDDLNNLIFDYQNPYTTSIIFVGGGVIALKDSLKRYFSNTNYTLHFMKDNNSLFANCFGVSNYIKNHGYIEEVTEEVITEEVTETITEELVPEVKDVITEETEKLVTINSTKSNKDIIYSYCEEGNLSPTKIHNLTGIGLSSCKSYVTKFKKERGL